MVLTKLREKASSTASKIASNIKNIASKVNDSKKSVSTPPKSVSTPPKAVSSVIQNVVNVQNKTLPKAVQNIVSIPKSVSTPSKVVITPAKSGTSNKKLRTDSPSVSTTIKKEEEQKNLYEKIDEKILGLLPFGVTPTEALTGSLREKTEQRKELGQVVLEAEKSTFDFKLQQMQQENVYNQEKTLLDLEKDIVSKKGLENIGLFRSPEEKAFQEQLAREQFFINQAQQVKDTSKAFEQFEQAKKENPIFETASSVPLTKETGFLSNFKNIGLLLGGGLLAYILVKRR